jgi:hypothetical protein
MVGGLSGSLGNRSRQKRDTGRGIGALECKLLWKVVRAGIIVDGNVPSLSFRRVAGMVAGQGTSGMENEGIKPDHVRITPEAPEPISGQAGSSLVAPVIHVPDLVSRPAWSAGAIIYVLALFLILWAGVLEGDGASYRLVEPPVSTLGAGLSLLFLVVGTVQLSWRRPSQDQEIRLTASVLVIVYCVITVFCEPFSYINGRSVQRLIFPIGWLVPLLFPAVWFARRRCWLQAIGVALFIFISAGLIAFNLYRGYSGFFTRILE